MEIYLIFCFLLFLFSIYENFHLLNYRVRNILLFLSFSGSVLLIGGRWETGTDWEMYYYVFTFNKNISDFTSLFSTEIGYALFNWVIRIFTNNYSIFIFIHAIVFYSFLLKSFNRLTKYPQTAFFFYFCSNLGIVGANRQLIALVILLNGIAFLVEKKKKSYVSSIILAFSFHSTAIFGGLYYFLNKYIAKKWILISLIVALFLGLSPLPLKLFSSVGVLSSHFSEKTDAYLGSTGRDNEYGLTVIGVFKRLFFFAFFMLIRDHVLKFSKSYNIMFNGYWLGLIIYLLFSSSLNVMVSRGSLYFNVMEALLLSSFLVLLKNPINKLIYIIILLVISILLMYQSIGEYPDLFDPYKGIWYNYDFIRKF